jgi:sialate O-acetylesterase
MRHIFGAQLTAAVLDAAAVREATSVRYGWADSPICNLYNSNDLRAVSFEILVHP